MIEIVKAKSLKEAMEIRKKLLVGIYAFGLQLKKVELNTSCMNINTITQLVENIPIYANDESVGKRVLCYISSKSFDWIWPLNCGIDCNYNPSVPLLDDQVINIEFEIVKGLPSDHIKFATVNSVGIREDDHGKFELVVEFQRNRLKIEC